MTAVTEPVDKSSWGDGPWQQEPDRAEWTHRGLPCLAVHGGLTYSDRCHDDICHVPAPGEPDDVWWFGFDGYEVIQPRPRG